MNRRFHEDFPITSLLLTLVGGFFVLELLAQQKLEEVIEAGVRVSPMTIHPAVFRYLGGLYPNRVIEDGEVWRLLASVFLHGGLIHLFFNGFVLFDLGRVCEPLLSPPKFLTVYTLCGLGGAFGRCFYGYVLAPGAMSVPSIGASGALLGLIGLLLVYSIRERHTEMKDALLRWIFFIVIFTVLIPNVDHAAHIGGFVTGCALGLTVRDYMTSTAARRWRIPSYIAGAAIGASLITALWTYFSAT